MRAASVCAALFVAALATGARADAAWLPAGVYTPFLRLKTQGGAPATTVAVPAFRLDVELVTNADFLDFVSAHPQWRRSRIKHLFADAKYLRCWRDDLGLADPTSPREPVTDVSWFAAQAYCRAHGERLPTTAQWEYALADAGRDRDRVRDVSLAWIATPNADRIGAVGQQPANGFGLRDMVGLVWEWTLDFDAYATSAEPRDSNGKDSSLVCGGAAAGATDATDYPGFMRFSLRASLMANYTAGNLGFRCAGEAP